MQSTGNRKKNKKKDCAKCPNHGICAAEENIQPYSCPIPDTPVIPVPSNSFRYDFMQKVFKT